MSVPARAMPGAIWKSALALLVSLVLVDLVGVFACVVFDISPFQVNSVAAPYVVWFVGGVFAGIFTLMWAGGWIAGGEAWLDRPDASRIAVRILLTSAGILAALSFFFWRIYWSKGVAGEYFVPDSMRHSLTYFLSALAVLVAAPFVLNPKAAPAA